MILENLNGNYATFAIDHDELDLLNQACQYFGGGGRFRNEHQDRANQIQTMATLFSAARRLTSLGCLTCTDETIEALERLGLDRSEADWQAAEQAISLLHRDMLAMRRDKAEDDARKQAMQLPSAAPDPAGVGATLAPVHSF